MTEVKEEVFYEKIKTVPYKCSLRLHPSKMIYEGSKKMYKNTCFAYILIDKKGNEDKFYINEHLI